MPIEQGRYGIKSWSYRHYVTEDGGVLCEDCIDEETEADASPIFADQEWTHYPECDACGLEADYVTLLEEDE